MSRQGRTAPSGEETKAVVQAIADLLHGQDSGSHRRELNRERQAVEPPAHSRNGNLVCPGQLEGAGSGRGPLSKEHHGLVPPKPSE